MPISPVALMLKTQVAPLPIVDKQPRVEVCSSPVLNMSEKNKSLVSIPAFVDAVLRAVFRFAEATVFSSPVNSTVFRLGSEIARHGTTGTIREAINNKPVTRNVLVKSVRTAIENTLGKIAFNTNVSGDPSEGSIKNSAVRILKGFGNMVIRVGYRVALIALDVMDPSELEPEALLDEFAGKSGGRAFCLPSDNAVVGIGSRIVEQTFINGLMENLPLKKWILGEDKKLQLDQLSKANPNSSLAA